MAKPTFADFSTTPADNTDINSIGIQGTNAVQNFDNAFRELMAILRRDVPGLTLANSYTKIQKWAKGADVASATSLTLGDDGNYFDITGTTAITSIATKGVGTVVKLHFDAGLTLTHNATDLILPGGANIVTAAGDEAEFIEYATGDWRCTNYSRASDNWVDVASATTTDIGAVASENVRVTGTTTITGLGTVAAGTFRRVRFAGALTLTHNATSLILFGANITTAAGDVFTFISEGSGNWRCVGFSPAAGFVRPTSFTSFTPTITGFGTVSSTSLFWKLIDGLMYIQGTFTSGTSTSTQARVDLPSGYQVDSTNVPTIRILGTAARGAANSAVYHMLGTGGLTYLTIGRGDVSNNPLSSTTGDLVAASGNVVSIQVIVPVTPV